MTHETTRGINGEREHRERIEVERKFVPIDPEVFAHFEHEAYPITQIYVNNPNDAYSLRLRRKETERGPTYTSTLKDRGIRDETGLRRMEIETSVESSVFVNAFNDLTNPRLTKRRAEPFSGVSIDWIDGYLTPIIEIENADIDEEASLFLATFEHDMIELTGSHKVDNEWIANSLSGTLEKFTLEPITAHDIVSDIAAYQRAGYKQLVIGIAGRSGSGKSTLAREVANKLYVQNGLTARLLETDWYHKGLSRLVDEHGAPWTNWELPEVYDIARLANDIKLLQSGQAVRKHRFDFASQEPVAEGIITPADVIIVEGIHAGSQDLSGLRQMFYEIPTPFATCLGRDLERIMNTDRPNSSIASPEERLRYILEIGEPTYQAIRCNHPRRNVFSASVRPLGNVARKLY